MLRNRKLGYTNPQLKWEEYDSLGFLRTRWGFGYGGTELHRYSYSRDYKTVLDSIIHLIPQSIFDSIRKAYIPTTDTIIQIERRIYNANNNLTVLFNKLLIKNWSLAKYLGFCPDSCFYFYNDCGNRDSILSFEGGSALRTVIHYNSLGNNRTGEQEIYVSGTQTSQAYTPQAYGSWLGQESRKFNAAKICTSLEYEGLSIRLNYQNKKIVSCEEIIPVYDLLNKKNRRITTHYKYNSDGLKQLKKVTQMDGDRLKKTTINIKRNKNGLLRIDEEGQELKYTYRQQ